MPQRQAVRFEDRLFDLQRFTLRQGHAIAHQRPGRADLKRITSRLLGFGAFDEEAGAVLVFVRQIAVHQLIERFDPPHDYLIAQSRLQRRHPQPPELLVDGAHRLTRLARLDQPRQNSPLQPPAARPAFHGAVKVMFVKIRARFERLRIVELRIGRA